MKRIKRNVEVVVAVLPDGTEKVFVDMTIETIRKTLKDLVPDGTEIRKETKTYVMDSETFIKHAQEVR